MKKRLLCSAIVAAMSLPTLALAQDAAVEDPAPNTGAVHFGVDLNFATSYFFRGYNQEDTGLIFQPNVYGYVDFIDADTDSTLSGLRLKLGSWNSLHSEKTGSPDDDVWYESDIYGVLSATIAESFYVNLGYTIYTYPGDALETTHEVGVSVGYDDTKHWTDMGIEGFGLKPEVGIYKEIADRNGTQDTYAEIKLSPGLVIDRELIPGFGKAGITFPVVLGLSVEDYYLDSDGDNELFGYIQGGVAVSLPITGIPARYGSWNLVGGVNYIHMLADSTEIANDGGTDYEVQGTIGISMTY